jgi:hypothetical protein
MFVLDDGLCNVGGSRCFQNRRTSRNLFSDYATLNLHRVKGFDGMVVLGFGAFGVCAIISTVQ